MGCQWARSLLCAGMLAIPVASVAAKLTLPAERPIVVRADAASNDPETNVTVFSGHFELQGTDWPMQADQATVYGPLEDPQRVLVVGNPARIWVKHKGVAREVAAQADEIEYTRGLDVLRLRGNARVVEGGRHVLEGDHFEYDLKTNRVRQGGPVRISILPKDAPTPAPTDAAGTEVKPPAP